MKIKDLLCFDPEAELQLLGMDYIPIDLSIYGWSSGDRDENPNVLLIPTGLENKYKTEAES